MVVTPRAEVSAGHVASNLLASAFFARLQNIKSACLVIYNNVERGQCQRLVRRLLSTSCLQYILLDSHDEVARAWRNSVTAKLKARTTTD